MEDKNEIVEHLFKLLKLTRFGSDITGMDYEKNLYSEYVNVHYTEGRTTSVNVYLDSGIALINDVLKQI